MSIWFSAGALIALITQYNGLDLLGQIITFVVTSILTFLIFRPALMKHIKTPKVRTNVDSLVGKTGEVIKDIKPLTFGQVKINGQIWTAKSLEDIEINEGVIVEVVEIEGVKLIVKEIERGHVKWDGSF